MLIEQVKDIAKKIARVDMILYKIPFGGSPS